MGSSFSTFGVGVGDRVGEFENQKCFFLVGGLPELVTAGDPDADKGLFGRFIIDRAFSARAGAENSNVVGSAVLGLATGLSISALMGEMIFGVARGVGLVAIELILPDTE